MPAAEPHLQIARTQEAMPSVVVAAVVLVGLFMLVDLSDALLRQQLVGAAITIAIATLILVGLVRRNALAWQWGVYMPILAALNGLAALAYATGPLAVALCTTALGANVAIPVLLTRAPSRHYFGVACPRCGSMRTGATDFLFNGHRCKDCNVEWRYQ